MSLPPTSPIAPSRTVSNKNALYYSFTRCHSERSEEPLDFVLRCCRCDVFNQFHRCKSAVTPLLRPPALNYTGPCPSVRSSFLKIVLHLLCLLPFFYLVLLLHLRRPCSQPRPHQRHHPLHRRLGPLIFSSPRSPSHPSAASPQRSPSSSVSAA